MDPNVATRSKDVQPQEDWFMGELLEELTPAKYSQLPTNGDVLRHYIYKRRNVQSVSNITDVIKSVESFWDWAGISVTRLRSGVSVKMLKKLISAHDNLRKAKKKPAKSFKDMCEQLFDIAASDAINIMQTDRLRSKSKVDVDIKFLIDQRSERKLGLGSCDSEYSQKVQSKSERILSEKRRRESSCPAVQITSGSVVESNDEKEIPGDADYVPTTVLKRQKRCESPYADILKSPDYQLTADRLKLSVRQRTYIAGAFYRKAGASKDDVVCSKTTSNRYALVIRKNEANNIKENFIPPKHSNIHWDGSKVKKNYGDRKKVEMLAISVSGIPDHKKGKLLYAAPIPPKHKSGVRMGRAEASEVHDACLQWDVLEHIVSMVFDTTATNSGHTNGACAIFELEHLKRKILWLACRHHVHEIVLETNYKCIFGPSSSPDNPVFVDFRDNVWDTLDTKGPYKVLNINSHQLKSRKAEVLEFYTDILTIENSEGVLPRDDYRETTELMMILLDATPPRGVRIYRPHGLHRARWMAMIIYEGKRYTFSDQLNLDSVTVENLHRFCLFNALYYCPAWLSAPKGVDAAVNDLQFWKDVHHYTEYLDQRKSFLFLTL